jgi:hypothetical protein
MVTVHPLPQYTEILNSHLTYIGGEMSIMSLLCGRVVYVPDSEEIPTRCSFVIEFIIPKFIEGSTCIERHTAHHQEL